MRGAKALAALCGWLLLQGCGSEPAAAPAEAAGDSAQGGAQAGNQPPVIEELNLEPMRPRPGQQITARVVARDPEGDPIQYEYHWRVAGRSLSETGPTIHVEGVSRDSTIEVTVTARDGHGESAPRTATARVGNLPPTIVSVTLLPSTEVTAGSDVTASPIGKDPDGGTVEYTYHWSVNGELVPVDGPTLPAKLFHRGDTIVLEVVASDGTDESEPLTSLPIKVVNAAPRVVSTPGPIGPDGVFRYTIKAEDPDGDNVFRYRLVSGPEGMTIGFDDGEVKWQPPADKAGSYPVEVAVEDLFGGRSTQKFSLQLAYETKDVAGEPTVSHRRRGQPSTPPAPPASPGS
jgi:hypothetical protein